VKFIQKCEIFIKFLFLLERKHFLDSVSFQVKVKKKGLNFFLDDFNPKKYV